MSQKTKLNMFMVESPKHCPVDFKLILPTNVHLIT